MTDNNRFAELIECFITNKIVRNQQEFVEKIGSDKATVSQIKNGKLPITNSILDKIKNAFPNVSVDWLLTGEGEMLKSDNSVKIFVPEDLPKQVGRLYRAPIYESYPVSAGLHGLAAIRDDKPDGYAYTTMPGVTFFPVIGCSFEPIIYAGEYIGVVKLNSWDRRVLMWFKELLYNIL